jgi:HAD superfamily hydrolase (TIGR01549 family)
MIKTILWDFDGVILDSMPVREYGFRKIFEKFDNNLVDKLLEYHNKNGGLSRYVKIKFFYEKLLSQDISSDEVNKIANDFSSIMRQQLTSKKYLIEKTIEFIKNNYKKYNFHIVSGSDQNELRFLCKELSIDKYFISIYGSPIRKNDLVKNLLIEEKYQQNEIILIGDSINDYEASKENNIDFYGYNNLELKEVSSKYLINFKDLER